MANQGERIHKLTGKLCGKDTHHLSHSIQEDFLEDVWSQEPSREERAAPRDCSLISCYGSKCTWGELSCSEIPWTQVYVRTCFEEGIRKKGEAQVLPAHQPHPAWWSKHSTCLLEARSLMEGCRKWFPRYWTSGSKDHWHLRGGKQRKQALQLPPFTALREF